MPLDTVNWSVLTAVMESTNAMFPFGKNGLITTSGIVAKGTAKGIVIEGEFLRRSAQRFPEPICHAPALAPVSRTANIRAEPATANSVSA